MRLRLKALVVVLLVSLFVAVMIPCVYSRYIRGETRLCRAAEWYSLATV